MRNLKINGILITPSKAQKLQRNMQAPSPASSITSLISYREPLNPVAKTGVNETDAYDNNKIKSGKDDSLRLENIIRKLSLGIMTHFIREFSTAGYSLNSEPSSHRCLEIIDDGYNFMHNGYLFSSNSIFSMAFNAVALNSSLKLH